MYDTQELGTEVFQFISNLNGCRVKKYHLSSFEESWIIELIIQLIIEYCPVCKIKSTKKKRSKAEKKLRKSG